MMGDYQVRFCEKLGVRLPLLTRQRFWRTIKYHYIYLNPENKGLELNKELKNGSKDTTIETIKELIE